MRIRTHHTFDIYSAFEKAIENKIDFRTFFEWYRNQEDYENECKIEKGDFYYEDRALESCETRQFWRCLMIAQILGLRADQDWK